MLSIHWFLAADPPIEEILKARLQGAESELPAKLAALTMEEFQNIRKAILQMDAQHRLPGPLRPHHLLDYLRWLREGE